MKKHNRLNDESTSSIPSGPQPLPPAPAEEPAGLECPQCGCHHFFVVYTRPMRNGEVLRRRECRHCGHRLMTCEQTPS